MIGRVARWTSSAARPMLTSTLYISKRLPPSGEDRSDLADIQHTAIARNRLIDVTGLMIVTTTNYMQYLEGRFDDIAALMKSIAVDKRHTDVTVLHTCQIKERRFPGWRMASFGPDDDLDRAMQPFLESQDRPILDQAADLIRLLEDVAQPWRLRRELATRFRRKP